MVLFSCEKTFTVDFVFNKQNDRVVAIGNDVYEHRIVSTTKYSSSILLVIVVDKTRRRCPDLAWTELQASLCF